MSSISRAQFLRGDWRSKKPDLRPPWSMPEPMFSDTCNGCGDCVTACSQEIISLSARKRPRLDFSQQGCTFCGDCVAACEPGALQNSTDAENQPLQILAAIDNNCLSKRGTYCERCIEECEHQAIVAKPAMRGRFDLWVEADLCTGCGFCVSGCPVDSISLINRPATNTRLMTGEANVSG